MNNDAAEGAGGVGGASSDGGSSGEIVNGLVAAGGSNIAGGTGGASGAMCGAKTNRTFECIIFLTVAPLVPLTSPTTLAD